MAGLINEHTLCVLTEKHLCMITAFFCVCFFEASLQTTADVQCIMGQSVMCVYVALCYYTNLVPLNPLF